MKVVASIVSYDNNLVMTAEVLSSLPVDNASLLLSPRVVAIVEATIDCKVIRLVVLLVSCEASDAEEDDVHDVVVLMTALATAKNVT